MAYTTINKSTAHFNTKLYTGNGGTQSITGVGFKPDFTWFKNRSETFDHAFYDIVRGAYWTIQSNTTSAQTANDGLTAWTSDGFNIGNVNNTNKNGNNICSWNWKANGAGSANTDGSITSTVSANTTAGFSIVKFSNGGGGATVGHGLGVVPKMIIVKRLDDSGYDWVVYHKNDTNGLYLNSAGYNNDGSSNSIWFDGVAPTSSVFSCGGDGRMTGSGKNFIAYCFADVKGFSKMISYTGNASTDGTFVYCGFKPSFILTKATATGEGWQIYDNKRLGFNVTEKVLYPNTSGSESTLPGAVDFLSNGFKWRTGDGGVNSNQLYVGMAFAEAPLVGTNNVPCTAR